jgi:hypothetical protein
VLTLFAEVVASESPTNWIAVATSAVSAALAGWIIRENRLEKRDKLAHDASVAEIKVELAECKQDRSELRARIEVLEKKLGV